MCLDATTKRDRERKLQCRGQVGGLVRLESSKQQEEEEQFQSKPSKVRYALEKGSEAQSEAEQIYEKESNRS
jgi:hypothetical protein